MSIQEIKKGFEFAKTQGAAKAILKRSCLEAALAEVAELEARLRETEAARLADTELVRRIDSDGFAVALRERAEKAEARAKAAEAELAQANKAIQAHVELMRDANTRAERQSRRADSYARTAQAALRDAGPALVEEREKVAQLEAVLSEHRRFHSNVGCLGFVGACAVCVVEKELEVIAHRPAEQPAESETDSGCPTGYAPGCSCPFCAHHSTPAEQPEAREGGESQCKAE